MAVNTGPSISEELKALALKLRQVPLPRHAPMEIAEQLQHCIARLETLARAPAIDPEEARRAISISEAMLKTLAATFPPHPPKKVE